MEFGPSMLVKLSSVFFQPVEKDISNLHLIVFRPVSRVDVVAYITGEQLRTVKVRLCRQESPDSPVHIAKIEALLGPSASKAPAIPGIYPMGVLVHFPPLPMDGRTYFVQLESSLSPSAFEYETPPVTFEANSSFKQVPLVFNPKPRLLDQEMNHGSYLLLPLIIAAVMSYFNRDKVIPFLQQVRQNGVSFSRPSGESNHFGGNGGSNREREREAAARERAEIASLASALSEPTVSKKKQKPRKT